MSFEEVEKIKKILSAISLRIEEAEKIVGNIIADSGDLPSEKSNVYRIDPKAIIDYTALCNKKMPIVQIVKKFDELSKACLHVIADNAIRKNNDASMRHMGEHYRVLCSIKKTLEQIKL
jgi:hypothetical protein